MKTFFAVLCLSFFLLSIPEFLFAQCSDAGVCIIGSKDQPPEHRVSAAYLFGLSGKEDDLLFHTIQVEGSIQIFPGSRLAVLFPFSFINGPLGNTSGAGDLIVLWNQDIRKHKDSRLSFQLGGKLATGLTNSGNLPQAYQPGLGTNDLIVGISFEINSWILSAGYQLSRGRSDNSVTRLKRGDDLFAQAGYKTKIDNLSAGIGILAIKRIHNSSVLGTSSGQEENFIIIPGSDQFQVNILGKFSLQLDGSYALNSMVAVPLNKRDVNVDGLKRSFAFSAGLQYTF